MCIRDRDPAAAAGAVRLSVSALDAPPACSSTRCAVSPGPCAAAATRRTSPSTGSSTDRACGPTSQRAPFSRRHGEFANGLSAPLNTEPSHCACAVNQPPAAACSAIHSSVSGWNRVVKNTTDATPASVAASANARPCPTVVASGLSSRR